ncbi:hypothetical protein [Sorangium sp. So ce381]|uniref:hypothetical protein n=1 Tax=Sorangium sp. So ce381 TaxID=3133307 RepID=UPI003F5C5B92
MKSKAPRRHTGRQDALRRRAGAWQDNARRAGRLVLSELDLSGDEERLEAASG